MRKNLSNSFVAAMVLAFAMALAIQPISAFGRILAWRVTNCATSSSDKCTEGVSKAATTGKIKVDDAQVSAEAKLYETRLDITVYQTDSYGELKVEIRTSNIGTRPPIFYRKGGNGWEQTGRPSNYKAEWVRSAIADLQKQDKDFNLSDR